MQHRTALVGPTNYKFDDQSRRPNLPLAFPCTLAMIRKVATMIGPGQPRSLIRMAGLVYESGERQRAASIKQQAATFCRATKLIIDLSNKQHAAMCTI